MTLHRISKPVGLLNFMWCWVRGISDTRNWRRACVRCGFTGQAHYSAVGPTFCWRFKPTPRGARDDTHRTGDSELSKRWAY